MKQQLKVGAIYLAAILVIAGLLGKIVWVEYFSDMRSGNERTLLEIIFDGLPIFILFVVISIIVVIVKEKIKSR